MLIWRKTLKVISNIITTLLFILLILTVFIVISTKAAGGEPTLFGYQLKVVLSGSMEPQIQTGSIIAINLDNEQTVFEKGDVITFRSKDDILITHRIIDIEEGGQSYITQGDNNSGPDLEPVLSQNIVGLYTGFTIPYVGYIVNFANSKNGTVLLLILPGILLLGYAGASIWSALRRLEVPSEKESTTNSE